MKYLEKHLLRKRTYIVEDSGVNVEDNGIFKSTRRFFKFESIGNEVNYTREEIASKILLILGLLGSSMYLVQKYELLGYVLAFAFISISLSMAISIIKNSSHIGTVSFRNSSQVNDTELYLKTDIPFSVETQNFIDSLRQANIEYSFGKILVVHTNYQHIKQNYTNQLNGLRDRLMLSQDEYSSLENRMTEFFTKNNVKDKYDEEE